MATNSYPFPPTVRLQVMTAVASMHPREALVAVRGLLKDCAPDFSEELDLATLRQMDKTLRWDFRRKGGTPPEITYKKKRGDWTLLPKRRRRRRSSLRPRTRRAPRGTQVAELEVEEQTQFSRPEMASKRFSKFSGQFAGFDQLLDPAYEFAFDDHSVLISMPWEKFGALLPHLRRTKGPISKPNVD